MRSLDLKPTKENLIQKLREDSLDRNVAIYRFIRLLLSIEDAMTISIDGDWGSGKTFFVKQLKLVLESYNLNFKISDDDKSNENINKNDVEQIRKVMSNIDKDFFDENLVNNPYFVIYYDAWENDDEVDPILSLIFRIVESVSEYFNIEINFKIFDNIPLLKEISIIKDLKSIFKFNSMLENQKQSDDIKQKIKDFLNSLLEERGNKLIVIIDELDRCSPSYAVKMLERIKHYFDSDSIIFIFSTNLSQLTYTIKKFYGEGYDSCRYLNRFFDLTLRLPEVNLEKYCSNIKFYDDNNYFITVVSRQVIKDYKLSLRQINKFHKLLKISVFNILKNRTFDIHYVRYFCVSFINPIAIALSIIDVNKYNDFISGKEPKYLVELLKNTYNNTWNERRFIEIFLKLEEYEGVDSDSIYLELQERFKQMYEAIFVEEYIKNHNIYIGKLSFDIEIKNLIQTSFNFLSDLSYFEG